MAIEGAEEALAGRRYLAALEELDRDPAPASLQWLELRAAAAYGAGDYEGAVAAWERMHALHRAAGERVPAARAAIMTATFLLIDAGLLSTVRGWLRRAEVDLAGADEGPVHALVAAVGAYERFFSGDVGAAARRASDAVALGERFDVMNAVAIGRTASGRAAVLQGDVEGGLQQLEDVAVLLMSGEVDDLTTGMMLCELICAAQGLLRQDLAQEWTEAMSRWAVTAAVGGIRGRCRVHQAELLRHRGPGDAAERTALQACEELRPWMRREYGWPLAELALVRTRRGDLAGAEEACSSVVEHCWPPHPVLALLRLEQGDVQAAAELIAAEIAHPTDAPSKELPPFGDLRLVPLFDAQSEIAMAASDPSAAEAAWQGLRAAAERYRSPAIVAAAELAHARHALLSGDTDAALVAGSAACTAFAALDAPYDVGRGRAVLAEAHQRAGNAAAARAELVAARAAYARYGSARRAAEIERRLDPRPGPVGAAAPVHSGVFHRDGPTWVIRLGSRSSRVKDRKGLRYLHRLVREPGREFHVLDLVAAECGTLRPAGADAGGIPLLDQAARDAYRRRLLDIDDDIEDATRHHDVDRLARAQADRDYLVDELARGVGIGGRIRGGGGAAERARTAVARALRSALDELAGSDAGAAEHFRSSLRTGTYCSYSPDPLAAVEWDVTPSAGGVSPSGRPPA